MKILVNVFHPDLTRSAVNSRWIEELRKDKNITVNVQYEQYPDWRINVEQEQKLLLEHDRIVYQHPFY